jgi:hypothetical protein
LSRLGGVAILSLLFVTSSVLAFTVGVDEAKSISRLYSAAFDRNPHVAGLNFWVDSYEAGRSLADIAGDFYKSPEFTKKYGALSDLQFVEQLYQNVLGRPGEEGGINFWTDHLANGVSRAKILVEFAESLENVSKTAGLLAEMRLVDGQWVLGQRIAGEYASRIAAGGNYLADQAGSCAVDNSGLRCWGYLGQSAVPISLKNPYQVDVDMHICTLARSGLHCWGRNDYGQANVPDDLVNPYFVSVGDAYTCVLHEQGVRCWGANIYGQTDVPKLINARYLSSDIHSCAIDDTGVVCWGSLNHSLELNVPRGLVNPHQVEVRFANTCVIDDNGVHCWGQSLSDPPFTTVNPRDLAVGGQFACVLDDVGVRCWGDVPGDYPVGLVNPREIAAGPEHWCVLDDTGVHCSAGDYVSWGKSHVPENLENPREVSAASDHTCAIDGQDVVCWGRGTPSRLSGFANPRALATGANHSCIISDRQGVSCWGLNLYGGISVPAGLVNPVEVSVGLWHSCAIDDYGVHCWGGHPWFSNEPPSNLIAPHGMVTGPGYENCVLDYGIVKCWGTKTSSAPKPKNQNYINPRQIQLGWGGLCVLDDNGVQCTMNPADIPVDLVYPSMISTGENACAIDANAVRCWGPNEYGQSNAPKTLFNPRQISVGFNHACALDDTGVHCWGSGEGNAAQAPDDLQFQ